MIFNHMHKNLYKEQIHLYLIKQLQTYAYMRVYIIYRCILFLLYDFSYIIPPLAQDIVVRSLSFFLILIFFLNLYNTSSLYCLVFQLLCVFIQSTQLDFWSTKINIIPHISLKSLSQRDNAALNPKTHSISACY